ncbi:MAG: DUF1848 domain-containing protein [Methanospirillaceae archaeon]|nr:DUF1848 domain-containing protein [Methanospirillaceae archaeon]
MQTKLFDEETPGLDEEAKIITDIHPVIISASRATDIPAWYMDWFIDRIQKGSISWTNPYKRTQKQIIHFDAARIIVFWTKNPAPLIPYLSFLHDRGYFVLVLITLNNYEPESFEPNLPPLSFRIQSLIDVSKHLSKEQIIWRYDPIIITDSIRAHEALRRIEEIGSQVTPYVSKMIFSFVQINRYKHLKKKSIRFPDYQIREVTQLERDTVLQGLFSLKNRWDIPIQACGERDDYSSFGIGKARCIDADHLIQICQDDSGLCAYLDRNRKKDPGQRALCSCIKAKDIGQYSTCMHLCAYCYANRNEKIVQSRYLAHRDALKRGIDLPRIVPEFINSK